ncbi:MAG: 50S ribosomal protein L32 [Candidatus Anoxychlamydiales bacterium]|nr:50S ribosomal protein L32 [Candidatus Anoxychlamydiales bacterium]NGX36537.1 50S ribosomal protein L32 [Candidatus Anoxychlamydiales bacterium]
MAVPRSRSSNSKKNSRSAHSALKAKSFSKCSNCNKQKEPHRVCPHCGFYANRLVISKEAPSEK